MEDIKNILFATDNSQCALEAYEFAIGFAEMLGAKLTVLSVIQEVPDLSIFDINMGRTTSEKKWLEARREYIQNTKDTYVENIKSEYKTKYPDANEIIVEMGMPSKLILLIAKERDCDFIVMGMKGRGRTLNEALMGDTTRHVLHHAWVPVLVVPPCDEKKALKALVEDVADNIRNIIPLKD